MILKELAKRDIKAIFFVLGCKLEEYPELGHLIIEHGHLIGNHTYEHLNIKKCSYGEYKRSIEKAEKYISSIYSHSNYRLLFRPPYGSFSIRQLFYVLFSKYLLINWTIDSRDSFILKASDLLKYCKKIEMRNGDILLFHEDYCQTVEALPEILDHIYQKGFKIKLKLQEFNVPSGIRSDYIRE